MPARPEPEETPHVVPECLVLQLTVLAALGSGLIADLFFTFSNTIMKALSRMAFLASEGEACSLFVPIDSGG